MRIAPSAPRSPVRFIAPAVVLAFLVLVLVNLSKTHFSVQVRSVIAAVEASPAVRAELGAPVRVERFGPLPLRRYSLRERDADVLSYRARVLGSRASGELEMMVHNERNQGWAGSYTVRTAARPVLRDGVYVQDSPRAIVEGRFDRDGRALRAAAVATASSATPR
jgi:hypothetical protein